MTEYQVQVIDGLSSEAGAVWPHMTKTVAAESAAAALDAIEAEIDANHWPAAVDYDCEAGQEITITISVTSAAGRAERAVKYEAA